MSEEALEARLIALGQSLRMQSREELLTHQRIRRRLFAQPQPGGRRETDRPQREADDSR